MMAAAAIPDPALIVAGIAGLLQAVQTWITVRDRQKAADVLRKQMHAGANTEALDHAARQLRNIAPIEILDRLKGRAERCWLRYLEVLDGNFLPSEIDEATEAVKLCICRELARIRSINGDLPPGKLAEWWGQYGCGAGLAR